ncbi:hypothetical protein Esti_002411 [Eimeria stiedai]
MSKYIPPHLRGAAAAGGGQSSTANESTSSIVSNLLRGRADAPASGGGASGMGGPQPETGGASAPLGGSGPLGFQGGGEEAGARAPGRGVWGREGPPSRVTRVSFQQRNVALRVVELDSLVIMKIIKHWRDFHPLPVNGQLLGSEVRDKLEVTNCFPLPQKKEVLAALQQDKVGGDVEERLDEEFDRYQDKMAELMHDVNVDCFTVGWYQTAAFSDCFQKEIVESLAAYQELVDKAVVLCFDPQKHCEGKTSFKTFRVNPSFLSKFAAYEVDVAQYSKLTAADILTEVPLVIKNAFLTEACFLDFVSSSSLTSEGLCFGFEQAAAVERGLSEVSVCLDLMAEEQEKLQRYQKDHLKQQQTQKQILERRRLENEQRRLRGEPLLPVEVDATALRPIDPPSLLPSLLLQAQALQHTKDVADACSGSLAKTFILNHVSQAAKETFEG